MGNGGAYQGQLSLPDSGGAVGDCGAMHHFHFAGIEISERVVSGTGPDSKLFLGSLLAGITEQSHAYECSNGLRGKNKG
jgi:hypothetical protein